MTNDATLDAKYSWTLKPDVTLSQQYDSVTVKAGGKITIIGQARMASLVTLNIKKLIIEDAANPFITLTGAPGRSVVVPVDTEQSNDGAPGGWGGNGLCYLDGSGGGLTAGPRGSAGGAGNNAAPGCSGYQGGNGFSAPNLVLNIDEVVNPNGIVLIVASDSGAGANGMAGANGGNGGDGGDGGTGSVCLRWNYEVENCICGNGGNGGNGADGGSGGNGGNGAPGGTITINIPAAGVDTLFGSFMGSKGGAGGKYGVGGVGGRGGLGGADNTNFNQGGRHAPTLHPLPAGKRGDGGITSTAHGTSGSNGSDGTPATLILNIT